MTGKINPKYVDGVARCNSDGCPGWESCPYLDHLDQLDTLGDISTSMPDMSVILCVPSMQKDLDHYKSRLDAAAKVLRDWTLTDAVCAVEEVHAAIDILEGKSDE